MESIYGLLLGDVENINENKKLWDLLYSVCVDYNTKHPKDFKQFMQRLTS